MPTDPYAVLRALLRAEAVRNTPQAAARPRPAPDARQVQAPPAKEHGNSGTTVRRPSGRSAGRSPGLTTDN